VLSCDVTVLRVGIVILRGIPLQAKSKLSGGAANKVLSVPETSQNILNNVLLTWYIMGLTNSI
jgi:hypothetical protein